MLCGLQEVAAENGLPCPVCMFMLGQLLAQIQDPSNQAIIGQGALQVPGVAHLIGQ